MEYLRRNEGCFDEIVLGINLDGAGYRQGKSAYSLYDCPEAMAGLIREAFLHHEEMVEGEAWYQGDHGLFLMNGRPALAVTSERFMEVLSEYAHTPKDSPEIVEAGKLVEVAVALREVVGRLEGEMR
jgi:aminopeptidase YwaD